MPSCKSKSTLIVALVFITVSLCSVVPGNAQSVVVLPTICDANQPNGLATCSTKEFGEILFIKFDSYYQYTSDEIQTPYSSEYYGCVAEKYKLLMESWWDISKAKFPRTFFAVNSPESMLTTAKSILDWTIKTEAQFSVISNSDVELCILGWLRAFKLVGGVRYSVTELNQKMTNFKREYNLEYHDIYLNYLKEIESSATSSDTDPLFESLKSQIANSFQIHGVNRISAHLSLLKDLKVSAQTALVVAANERKALDASAAATAAKDAAAAKAASKVAAKEAARAAAKDAAQAKAAKAAAAAAAKESAKVAAKTKAALAAGRAKGMCFSTGMGRWFNDGQTAKWFGSEYLCQKGDWKTVTNGGSNSGQVKQKILIAQYCELKATALTSSVYGQQYIWTIWNKWSDGSKSVATGGAGYSDQVPVEC